MPGSPRRRRGLPRDVHAMLGVGCLILTAILVAAQIPRMAASVTRGTNCFAVTSAKDGTLTLKRVDRLDPGSDTLYVIVFPYESVRRPFMTRLRIDHHITWDHEGEFRRPPISHEQELAIRAAIVAKLDHDGIPAHPTWRSHFLIGDGVTSIVRWQGYVEYGIVIGLVAASLAFFWRAIVKRAA